MFKTKRKVVTLLINEDLCTGCGNCVVRCRRNVLNILNDQHHRYAFVASAEDCKGCRHCMGVCPTGAIQVTNKK